MFASFIRRQATRQLQTGAMLRQRNAVASVGAVRHLNLHEYQSKALMESFNIRVQRGNTATTPAEALAVAQELKDTGAAELVVKAQIHAGGRGKGHFDNGFKGGVKVSTDPAEVSELSSKMLGANLITKQTGAQGQPCNRVLIVEGLDFEGITELYLAFVLDRAYDGPVIVASTQGGMDIEEVAERDPSAIVKVPVPVTPDGTMTLTPELAQQVVAALGLAGTDSAADAAEQVTNLFELFKSTDCTQLEINPFVRTRDGKTWCVDAKLNHDDNAAFRHKELFAQRDFAMEDQREVEASKHDLNYIGLDGNIGCMVNGAGLAMATMDIINMHGGSPANFLDVGGGANEQQVESAFRLLNDDPSVKAILVNIFGGIMKCDVIAQGIVNAAKKVNLSLPLVVRLEGTNVDIGNKILTDSGIQLSTAATLDEAAKMACNSLQ